MINDISTNDLENVSKYVEKMMGLHFHEKRYKDLKRALINAAKLKNIGLEEYINYILFNPLSKNDFNNLAACLTIGETYFFRDKKLFSVMKQNILPNLINSKKNTNRSLKIWSAGCSSGEEVYSIAILIKELIKDYKNWNVKIIATDINHSFLNKAKNAVYSEWSFRGIDLNIKNKYFKKTHNNYYKLNKEIVELVEFHDLNLADSNYEIDSQIINNVDIIFCRNVLMYFSKPKIKEIVSRFYNIIANEGWLIVAPTESLFLNDTSFIPVKIDDMFLYNKKYSFKGVNNNILGDNSIQNCDRECYNSFYDCVMLPLEGLKVEEKGLHEDKVDLTTIRKVNPPSFIGGGNYLDNETLVGVKSPFEVVKNSIENDALKELEKLFRSYANEGKLEKAIECCKNAITLDKTNSYYYYFLASIQQEQGNINEAIISLRRCIFLDYDFIMAYFDLGNLNLKQEKYEEAFKNFEIVYSLLNGFDNEEVIPYSEEITVGYLKKIIRNINWVYDVK